VCTVAWVATGGGGYLLGHNRDESLARGRALPPTARRAGDRRYLAPTDADAGGTWIAANDSGLTVCMLNAADRHPERLPAVPESRGRLALDLADCTDLDDIRARVDGWSQRMRGVRAFHLVAVHIGDGAAPPVADWHRWDGIDRRVERVVPPGLFVSALLDQSGAERERGRSWRRFLDRRPDPDGDDLARWLANHEPSRGMLSACVHRADARTVSRTVVRVGSDRSVEVRYLDGAPCDPDAPESVHALSQRDGDDRGDQPR